MALTLGQKDYHSPWNHNAVCDVCGMKFKGNELRKRWDNLMVCDHDFEERHPQDFVKGIIDRQNPPYVRDMPELEFKVVTTTDGSEF